MAYTDFTLESLQEKFGISNRIEPLFDAGIELFEISDSLKTSLQDAQELPLRSEKSKSEFIVVPILNEIRKRNGKFFTIYSGENLNADQERGLNGECDFILAKDTSSFNISFPIIQVVEAKKNDVEIGVSQCAAQLLGAKIFNEKKGVKLDRIYGCVTTGNEWLFLMLENDLKIDNRLYYIVEIKSIIAVFQQIIDYYKNI